MPSVPVKAVLCGMISPTLQPEAPDPSSTINHGPRFWLKAEALANMLAALVTEETSQSEMSPLKAVARWNIPHMVVTLDVSQVETLPLKGEP